MQFSIRYKTTRTPGVKIEKSSEVRREAIRYCIHIGVSQQVIGRDGVHYVCQYTVLKANNYEKEEDDEKRRFWDLLYNIYYSGQPVSYSPCGTLRECGAKASFLFVSLQTRSENVLVKSRYIYNNTTKRVYFHDMCIGDTYSVDDTILPILRYIIYPIYTYILYR